MLTILSEGLKAELSTIYERNNVRFLPKSIPLATTNVV